MIALLLIIFTLIYIYFKTRQKIRCDLPGPKPYPILGNALEFLSEEPLNTLMRNMKQYGRIFKITLASDLYVIITDPVDVEVIMSSTKYISKALSYKFLSSWLKDGLITSDGEIWHRHRKLLTPTFHFKILENSAYVMTKNSQILATQLETQLDQNDFNIQQFIEKCSLDIICESAMDVEVNSQTSKDSSYLHAVKNVTEITVKRLFRLWLQPEFLFKLSGYAHKFSQSLNIMENLSKQVIVSKRQKLEQLSSNHSSGVKLSEAESKKKTRIPLLDLMLTEGNFTDEQIHAEVMSFMFAGHDTTTSGISFVLYKLAKHQDVQEKVYHELMRAVPDNGSYPGIQDLNNLKYTECVIKETFRLYPPVPMIGRVVHEEVQLPSGYKLPAGAQINIFIYGLHHDPTVFPDPEEFIPERFNDGSKYYHPFSHIPFSAGPRNCIGQRFAMLEIKIVLWSLLRKYRLLPATGTDSLTLTYELILRSKHGIPVQLAKREIIVSD